MQRLKALRIQESAPRQGDGKRKSHAGERASPAENDPCADHRGVRKGSELCTAKKREGDGGESSREELRRAVAAGEDADLRWRPDKNQK